MMQPAPIIARKIAGYRDKPKGCTTVFDRRLGTTLIFLMLALGNAYPARAAADTAHNSLGNGAPIATSSAIIPPAPFRKVRRASR